MIPWIDSGGEFPPASDAISEPNGLLCAGADLQATTLLNAYQSGLFPWYSDGQPILWWSPNPRAVFFPDQIHLSRRLRQTLRSDRFSYRLDHDFDQVIQACATTPRAGQDGTWITEPMLQAYLNLHRLGHAHCLSVYEADELVGGIYGIAIGGVFFGESMFSHARDASKAGLVTLGRWLHAHDFGLLDAQVESGHIMRMGAQLLDRTEFLRLIGVYCKRPGIAGSWSNLL